MVPARLTYDADAGYCANRDDGAFWLFHNPGFCISGGKFAQPVGGLRDDFSFDECGSLDAPECICLGGISSDITVHRENGKRYISERSTVFRDHIADLEERAADDDGGAFEWDAYVYHDEDLPPEPTPNTCIHVEPLHTIGRDVWCASINGVDLSGPLGWGDTAQQAVDSLIEEASARRLIGYHAAHALPVHEIRAS